jgi:hypothetical protein
MGSSGQLRAARLARALALLCHMKARIRTLGFFHAAVPSADHAEPVVVRLAIRIETADRRSFELSPPCVTPASARCASNGPSGAFRHEQRSMRPISGTGEEWLCACISHGSAH